MTTLKEAIASVKTIKGNGKTSAKKDIAKELLGKYKDIISKGGNSSKLIRNYRQRLYGKIS